MTSIAHARTFARPTASAADTAAQYETYYRGGHYDRRYPRGNPMVVRRILSHLPAGGRLLDYGCGNGRYLLPLAARAGRAIGFDISHVAVDAAAQRLRAAGLDGRARALGPDIASLERLLQREGPVDVAACLFGVLSHIDGAAARRDVLRFLGRWVTPRTGRLVISVPNRHRRFLSEQRAQRSGDSGEITYSRHLSGDRIDLSYKLFDPEALRDELTSAGLEVLSIASETTLPERAISTSRAARGLDRLITPLTPPRLAYGLIATARPKDAA